MSFLLAQGLLVASGLGVLGLLRLRTRAPVADAALAWLAGGAWFAAGEMALRFLARLPYSRWSAGAVCLAPPAAWLLVRARSGAVGGSPPVRTRWIGRPAWIFGPMAAYVIATAAIVALRGFDTPTQTDDGVRVRAFAPMLAFDDGWSREAVAVLAQAGPIPTFVPSLAWELAGRVDHFHVNYTVLATLLAFLALAIALGAGRGAPERGWAAAFGAMSLPLFVYHCTTTYSDAVLAMYASAGLLFHVRYSQEGGPDDAGRAFLLYAAAAMVKQEGEVVAGTCAAVLLPQVAWRRRRGEPIPARALLPPAVASAVLLAARAAAGAGSGVLRLLAAARQAGGAGAAAAPASSGDALPVFARALFTSGNAGMLFWVFPVAVVAAAAEIRRRRLGWPLAAVLALFLEAAASSVWLFPAYTLDGSTVNRALLTVSVAASVWLAALLVPRPSA